MLEKLHQVVEMRSPLLLLTVRLSQHQRVWSILSIPVAAPCLVCPAKHEGCVRVAILDAELRDLVHDLVAIYAAEPIVVVHEPVQAVALGQLPLPPPHLHVAEVVVPQPPFLDAERLPDLRSLERPQQRPLCKIRPPELVVLGDGVVLGKKNGHGLRRRRYLGQPQGQQPQGGRDVDLEQRLLRVFAVRGMAAQLQPQRLAELHDARRRARPQVELPPPSPVHATHDGHSALPLGQVAPEASQPGAADGTVARRLALEAPLPKPRQDVVRARFVGHHGAQRGHQAKRPFLGEQSLDRVDLGRRAAERLHRPPRHVGPLVGAQQQRQIVGRARGLGLLQLPGEHLRVGVAGHLVDARLAEHRE
mmetsp:Transcript_4331/g.12293  ORF Transcript_4331/g.12293 Transcript_4331/m.12293 type:complete len:362 (+) Transcript_4331:773-1858(+)